MLMSLCFRNPTAETAAAAWLQHISDGCDSSDSESERAQLQHFIYHMHIVRMVEAIACLAITVTLAILQPLFPGA